MGKQKRYARHRDRGSASRRRSERLVPAVLGGLVAASTEVGPGDVVVRQVLDERASLAPPPVPSRRGPVPACGPDLPSWLLARWRARWGLSGPGPGQVTDAPAAPVQVVGDDHPADHRP